MFHSPPPGYPIELLRAANDNFVLAASQEQRRNQAYWKAPLQVRRGLRRRYRAGAGRRRPPRHRRRPPRSDPGSPRRTPPARRPATRQALGNKMDYWCGVVFPMVYVIILAVLFNVTLDDDYLGADSEMYHGLGKVSIDGLYKYNSNWLICALQPV